MTRIRMETFDGVRLGDQVKIVADLGTAIEAKTGRCIVGRVTALRVDFDHDESPVRAFAEVLVEEPGFAPQTYSAPTGLLAVVPVAAPEVRS